MIWGAASEKSLAGSGARTHLRAFLLFSSLSFAADHDLCSLASDSGCTL